MQLSRDNIPRFSGFKYGMGLFVRRLGLFDASVKTHTGRVGYIK